MSTATIRSRHFLPRYLGTSVPKENVADLKTEGWEITLGWKDRFKLGSKPFDYQFGFNLADSRAYITKFRNTTGTLSSNYEGKEIGEIWGYTTLGFFTSQEDIDNHADQSKLASYASSRPIAPGDLKFADLDGDGEVYRGANTLDDHGDLRVIGNSRSRFTYGFTAGGNWNGFDLSLFLAKDSGENYKSIRANMYSRCTKAVSYVFVQQMQVLILRLWLLRGVLQEESPISLAL